MRNFKAFQKKAEAVKRAVPDSTEDVNKIFNDVCRQMKYKSFKRVTGYNAAYRKMMVISNSYLK